MDPSRFESHRPDRGILPDPLRLDALHPAVRLPEAPQETDV